MYRRPQSNGFLERLHRTLLDEHFRVAGRSKRYESVDEMQKDLKQYNHERPHQGRNMKAERLTRHLLMESLKRKSKKKR